MVTVTLYRRNGLKRGAPVERAGFGQWIPDPDKGRHFIALHETHRDGNAFRLQPITPPLGSRAVTLTASAGPDPGPPYHPGGSAEFGANDGDAVEVWL